MSANTTPGSHKPTRVLACVLCQHRKIKCDRNTPCANCIKANVTCTPSTPAPARKRRRPNQDLQERLARCEQLLKQYADGSVPSPSAQQAITPSVNGMQSEPSPTPSVVTDFPAKWKPKGKMVKEEGGVRFMDSYLWASIHEELQAMKEIVDTDEPEESSTLGSEDLSPDTQIDLLLPSDAANAPIEELQPDPVHAFRLWQLFLDRVNPLTKVIHVPTLQPYVMEAATNMNNIPFNYQALLFSIFTMAVVSLSEVESVQLLGMSRDDALRKFTMGTKVALTKFDFMRNYDMAALQALLLYSSSLQNRYDRHAAWILSGMIVRIAQKMGYHRDGETLGLTPFETEMRRRIWWLIMMQDAKNALVSGLSHSMLPTLWDTKPAQNVNDADIFPGSTEPIQPREGPTEMAFALLVYEIAKFMIGSEALHGPSGFEAVIMGQDVASGRDVTLVPTMDKYRALVDDLEANLLELENKYIDASAGSVHAAALTVRPMLTSKLREMLVPMQEQPEWGTEIFNAKDNLFKIVIMNNEHSTNSYETMDQKGFLWFVKQHFQLEVFAVMTGQLCKRPTGSLADRAWNVVDKIYTYHPELLDLSNKAYAQQAQFVLRAWKAREQAFAQMGRSIDLPHFIYRLRECLGSGDSSSSDTMMQLPTTQQPVSQPQITELDPLLGGYLDVSALNWDMWGDFSGNMGNLPPSAGFGPFGMSGMGSMG